MRPPSPGLWSLSLAIALPLAACDEGGVAGPHPLADRDDAGDVVDPGVRCLPADGRPGTPTTIADALAWMDALPQPVDTACFLQSLARPLQVTATTSEASAQPAGGDSAPRIFLTLDDLIVSIVPDGPGATVMEFAERVGPRRSIKGELALPTQAPLAPTAPFEPIREATTGGTVCGSCHHGEREADASVGSYASVSWRPEPDTVLDVAQLRILAEACDADDTPQACATWSALFDHGPVQDAPLPTDWSTFHERGGAGGPPRHAIGPEAGPPGWHDDHGPRHEGLHRGADEGRGWGPRHRPRRGGSRH